MFKIELGPCPVNEDAVQLSDTQDNSALMKRQCFAWKQQLERTLINKFGDMQGVTLRVKNLDHDFGTYYVGSCHDSDERAIDALFWLESNSPEDVDADLKY